MSMRERENRGTVIIYGGGGGGGGSWHRRELFFLVKVLPIQPLTSQKKFYPTLNINSPWPKNFTKGCHSVVTHGLYHFCDMSLITACAIFCSLKFHVVCTCTFFGDTICLLTNRKMIKSSR
jgi:hypothetical protein